jgi:hypothetical protein
MPTKEELSVLQEAAVERQSTWQDGKKNYVLPTGNQLMSAPIVKGGRVKDRYQKEREFVVKKIDRKLKIIGIEENFQLQKWILFVIGLAFALSGVVLILYGFHTTVFFEMYQQINIPAIVFGVLFTIPLFVWMVYLYFPDSEEKKNRRRIQIDQIERKKDTFFNKMVKEAEQHATPPDRVLEVTAHVRKKNYPIKCTSWWQFCNAVEKATGLSVERQLIRFRDEDLEIPDLKVKLEDCGITDGDILYIYNRGGYFTKNSPLKLQSDELKAKAMKKISRNPSLEKSSSSVQSVAKSDSNIPQRIKAGVLYAFEYIREGRYLVAKISPEEMKKEEENQYGTDNVETLMEENAMMRNNSFSEDVPSFSEDQKNNKNKKPRTAADDRLEAVEDLKWLFKK